MEKAHRVPDCGWGEDPILGLAPVSVSSGMIESKKSSGSETVVRARSPEEQNIVRQLGKVRRYLAKAPTTFSRNAWESRIALCEKQLAKAKVRAALH